MGVLTNEMGVLFVGINNKLDDPLRNKGSSIYQVSFQEINKILM